LEKIEASWDKKERRELLLYTSESVQVILTQALPDAETQTALNLSLFNAPDFISALVNDLSSLSLASWRYSFQDQFLKPQDTESKRKWPPPPSTGKLAEKLYAFSNSQGGQKCTDPPEPHKQETSFLKEDGKDRASDVLQNKMHSLYLLFICPFKRVFIVLIYNIWFIHVFNNKQ
jgi:hypothetical protein